MNIFQAFFLLILIISVPFTNQTGAGGGGDDQTSGGIVQQADSPSRTENEIKEMVEDEQSRLTTETEIVEVDKLPKEENLESPPSDQSSPALQSPESKRIKLHVKIPTEILEFFRNPELPEEDYLDTESNLQLSEGEISFKKAYEEIQKYMPLVIQREKFENINPIHFLAATLIVKILTKQDAEHYIFNNNELLQKIIGNKNFKVKYDLEDYKHYDMWFTSLKLKRRLIPACPDKKVVNMNFPSGVIIKGTKTATEEEFFEPISLDAQLEGISDISSSDEDEDIRTTEGAQSKSEISQDQGSLQTESSLNQTPAKLSRKKRSPPKSNSPRDEKRFSSAMASLRILKGLNFNLKKLRIPEDKNKKDKAETNMIRNTFKGTIMKTKSTVEETDFLASEHLCDNEVIPTFVKEEEGFQGDVEAYYAGYVVEFKRKVTALYANFLRLSDKTLWFHVAHLLKDKYTKDTLAVFSYAPFYSDVRKMKKIPTYTDYTVNQYSHRPVEYYEQMYSLENQRKIFENFNNPEKYFDPDNSLYFVKQELMDQKSIPTMAYKRVALDYMNIVPIYEVVKKNAWRKVENVVLKLPMISSSSTVMFITGTYGELLINGSAIYLDDGLNSQDDEKTKRIKVPYAIYKVVHVTYHSARHDKFLHDHLKFFFNIVIVTHNDIFEKKPKKICDTPVQCESIGWTKVVQTDSALGFTYCCAFTKKFADDFGIRPMYEGIKTVPLDDVHLGLLDLRALWYVETNQSTRPLDRNEFPLIQKEKPVYENGDHEVF